MYTPRGELNESFLQLLYQKDILKQLENCKNQKEISNVLKQSLKQVELHEITESLEIIQSYLDEEEKECILTNQELDFVVGGMQSNIITGQNKVLGLMNHYPNIGKSIHTIYKNIQIR